MAPAAAISRPTREAAAPVCSPALNAAPSSAGGAAPGTAPLSAWGAGPLAAPLSAGEAAPLAALLKALADPARLQLLSLLAAHESGEACVCDLIEPLGLAQPTVSHHLRVLLEAGLVRRDKRGVWAYYRCVPEALDRAQAAMRGLRGSLSDEPAGALG